jgi:hypothetical protein
VPQVYATSPSLDDFVFGADGSIFAATQLGSIIRFYPNGTQTSTSTGTLGDAALAFGRTSADVHDLYVINNGGAFLGLADGPMDASIVRLSTDTSGTAVPEPSSLLISATGGILILLRLKRRRLERPIAANPD